MPVRGCSSAGASGPTYGEPWVSSSVLLPGTCSGPCFTLLMMPRIRNGSLGEGRVDINARHVEGWHDTQR